MDGCRVAVRARPARRALHTHLLPVNRAKLVPLPDLQARYRSGTEQYPWRPFCSERCKLVDLGAWMSETRAIPGEPLDESAADP